MIFKSHQDDTIAGASAAAHLEASLLLPGSVWAALRLRRVELGTNLIRVARFAALVRETRLPSRILIRRFH